MAHAAPVRPLVQVPSLLQHAPVGQALAQVVPAVQDPLAAVHAAWVMVEQVLSVLQQRPAAGQAVQAAPTLNAPPAVPHCAAVWFAVQVPLVKQQAPVAAGRAPALIAAPVSS